MPTPDAPTAGAPTAGAARFHSACKRWLELAPGLRTVALTAMGAGLTVPIVLRVVAVEDPFLADALLALAAVLGPLFLLYPASKAASGLRDRWRGDDYLGGHAYDVPPVDELAREDAEVGGPEPEPHR